MKHILLSTLLLFFTGFLFSQSDDYALLQLKRGSLLSGNIIDKSYNSFTLKTSLLDTLKIRNRSIKKLYIVEENFDYQGDVPVLVRGRYYTFSAGVGGGRQRINLQNRPFFFFPGSTPILPITRYFPMIVARVQGSAGYQFNRNFGLGVGLILRYNSLDLPQEIIPFGQNRLIATPYLEGKFNYPLKKYGNKDLWVTVNAFQHAEVVVGVSFLQPKRRLNIGVGFFKGFNSFQADSYLSLQCGMQF